MGSGSHRCVTLSHTAQVKRFTADVLRILKLHASKQISIVDLPIVYGLWTLLCSAVLPVGDGIALHMCLSGARLCHNSRTKKLWKACIDRTVIVVVSNLHSRFEVKISNSLVLKATLCSDKKRAITFEWDHMPLADMWSTQKAINDKYCNEEFESSRSHV